MTSDGKTMKECKPLTKSKILLSEIRRSITNLNQNFDFYASIEFFSKFSIFGKKNEFVMLRYEKYVPSYLGLVLWADTRLHLWPPPDSSWLHLRWLIRRPSSPSPPDRVIAASGDLADRKPNYYVIIIISSNEAVTRLPALNVIHTAIKCYTAWSSDKSDKVFGPHNTKQNNNFLVYIG